MDQQGDQAGDHSQASRYLTTARPPDTKMSTPEVWAAYGSAKWYEAVRLLEAGEIEKARELLPLMLPSDRIVMGRKIAKAEKK